MHMANELLSLPVAAVTLALVAVVVLWRPAGHGRPRPTSGCR